MFETSIEERPFLNEHFVKRANKRTFNLMERQQEKKKFLFHSSKLNKISKNFRFFFSKER